MSKTLYLNVSQIIEMHEKDVYLKDVAKLYCDDKSITSKCNAIKIKSIKEDRDKRYVESMLDIIKKVSEVGSTIQVNSIGEADYIIDYQKVKAPRYMWQWCKTLTVYAVCSCEVTFAIMMFNDDVSVEDIFEEVYLVVLGKESPGFTILEVSYSVRLALGIIVSFNHFAVAKLSIDPTPVEVEIRLYEDNISKTLIQSDGRKESGIDVT